MIIVRNIHDLAWFLKEVKGMSFEAVAKIAKKPVTTVIAWAEEENWGSHAYSVNPNNLHRV